MFDIDLPIRYGDANWRQCLHPSEILCRERWACCKIVNLAEWIRPLLGVTFHIFHRFFSCNYFHQSMLLIVLSLPLSFLSIGVKLFTWVLFSDLLGVEEWKTLLLIDLLCFLSLSPMLVLSWLLSLPIQLALASRIKTWFRLKQF